MKIIDAHIHCLSGENAELLAQRAGHTNDMAHLGEENRNLNISGAVVMGNRGLALENHVYPDFMRYCIGLDRRSGWSESVKKTYDLVERHLQQKSCAGVKLYPGYDFHYVSDKLYIPIYELAERYARPVAIHTGETSFPASKLKYCHPLTLDEVAASFPNVQFVMCHMGNPWFADAAAVIYKNKNVSADLSGLLEGMPDIDLFFLEQEGYINIIRTWIAYPNAYDRIMFGTDWPLTNIRNYIDFIARLIPEKHHEMVFSENAQRIYRLDF